MKPSICFDENEQILFVSTKFEPCTIQVFCLKKFNLLGEILFPSGYKMRRFWLSPDGTKLGAACFRASTNRDYDWINLNEQILIAEYDLQLGQLDEFGLLRRVFSDLQHGNMDQNDRKDLQRSFLNTCRLIPNFLLNRQPVIPALAYVMDDYEIYTQFGSEILSVADLIQHHAFFKCIFQGNSLNSMKAAVELLTEYLKNNTIDAEHLREPIVDKVLNSRKELVKDQHTINLFKLLMFRKTAFTRTGQLQDDDISVCKLEREIAKISDIGLSESLMKSDPNKGEVFRLYETRTEFTLASGSKFNSEFFKMRISR